ncbi:MAG: hypothetical protein R6X33_04625, partial [Candidatus Brocadiia bacterium]
DSFHTVHVDTSGSAYDAPHWQDNSEPPDGDAEDDEDNDRMYPVCFTRDTKMKTSVRMVVKPVAAFGYNLEIKGDGPGNLDIAAASADIVGDTARLSNATCEAAFPNYVTRYDTLDIVWSLSTDGGQTWQEVGTSKNETFITRVDPPQDLTLYRTVAYLACVEEGATEEGEALTNTWSAFAPVSGQDDVCAWNEETDDYDRPLYYWQDQNPASTVSGLLQGANGNCDAWTRLFRESLRVNGADVDRIAVRPPFGDPASYFRLVIKNVTFDEQNPDHPNSPPWIYSRKDLDISPEGIAGQNTPTPAEKIFWWHLVARFITQDPETKTYYDPSYGKTYGNEADLTEEAIAGFGMVFGPDDVRFRKVSDLNVQFQTTNWQE